MRATRVGVHTVDERKPETYTCARCGAVKWQGKTRMVVCRDCKWVMSAEELRAWAA